MFDGYVAVRGRRCVLHRGRLERVSARDRLPGQRCMGDRSLLLRGDQRCCGGLPYIDEQALEAGGDPWAINASLQAGSPLEISNLAGAFHRAGRCTAEAENAFQQARARFEAAWNHHDGGGHPINDSDEVQRVTKSLGAQSLQLPKIAADLENIAASLADAQKAGAARIATLEAQLKNISDMVSQAV